MGIFSNSEALDEMRHNAAFQQGLHCMYLKGTYQGFSFFFAISFYVSDFMYLLRNQFIFYNFQW